MPCSLPQPLPSPPSSVPRASTLPLVFLFRSPYPVTVLHPPAPLPASSPNSLAASALLYTGPGSSGLSPFSPTSTPSISIDSFLHQFSFPQLLSVATLEERDAFSSYGVHSLEGFDPSGPPVIPVTRSNMRDLCTFHNSLVGHSFRSVPKSWINRLFPFIVGGMSRPVSHRPRDTNATDSVVLPLAMLPLLRPSKVSFALPSGTIRAFPVPSHPSSATPLVPAPSSPSVPSPNDHLHRS